MNFRSWMIWSITVVAVIAGIGLRFMNIDRRWCNVDEVHTGIDVAGYAPQEVIYALRAHPVCAGDFKQFTQLNSKKTWIDCMQALKNDQPFNPPLYFLLARCWAEHLGTTLKTMRELSAYISLLEIPSAYLFCAELFASPLAAAITVALMMISPYHLLAAQEARPYSLWTVLTLFSGFALLRALRTGGVRSWILYSATILLSLFTHLSALRVLLSFLVYVVALKKVRMTNRLRAFLCASVVPLMMLIPWLIDMYNRILPGDRHAWFRGHTPVSVLIIGWCDNLTRIFADLTCHMTPLQI
jgi:uncharacterized membrane protein